jgi:hypothetical protein
MPASELKPQNDHLCRTARRDMGRSVIRVALLGTVLEMKGHLSTEDGRDEMTHL